MSKQEGAGGGLVEQQLDRWVRENVAFPDHKIHGHCVKVVIRHLSVDRKPIGDVAALAVKLEEGFEGEYQPLMLQIAERAQQHADDWNQGLQTYALYAYYDKDRGYVPYKLFRVSASDVEVSQDLTPSEPPSEKGLAAQAMRHLEAVMRTTSVTNAQLFSVMQQELRRLAEMNERFGEQQVDMMVLMQDLTNHAHERRLSERSAEANIAMKEEAMSKLAAIAPVIINKLAGGKILPEEDQSLMLMASLLESMTPEQQETIYKNLTDAQRMVLAEVLEHYEKKKSKWMSGQKKKAMGLGNQLPDLSPKKSQPETSLVTASPAQASEAVDAIPMPTAMPLRERMKLTPARSSDPVIQQLEEDVEAFGARFRDRLCTPKNGDKT